MLPILRLQLLGTLTLTVEGALVIAFNAPRPYSWLAPATFQHDMPQRSPYAS
jgi:hypothetical protein